MSLFRFFFKKPPDGLFQLCERVYVFDRCFTTEAWEEDEYRIYVRNIVAQLRDQFADASFLAFDFREGGQAESQTAKALSENDMTVMDYPRQFEGCPLLKMELVHHFLRSSESWLSLGHQNLLLMHCQRGAWPVLAFMLAALLVYKKQCNGELKTLETIHKQAPQEILRSLSPLNPIPSQVRYLQYVSRRNVVDSEWPPADRKLVLDCVILRFVPDFFGDRDSRPGFRIYGHDYSRVGGDQTPKVLYSTPKRNKLVRPNKQAERELVKIDINCRVLGDVVVECLSLNDGVEREEMMFRFVFNTAFIRSNILMLNRDEVDVLWDSRDRFPKEFRAEILFSEMDATTCAITRSASCFEEKDGLPEEAFAKVQELFSQVDLNMLQHISASKIDNLPGSPRKSSNIHSRKKVGKLHSDSPTSTPGIHSSPTEFTNTKPSRNENTIAENVEAAASPEPELLKPESITISHTPKSIPPPPPPPPPPLAPFHFSSPKPKKNASPIDEITPETRPLPSAHMDNSNIVSTQPSKKTPSTLPPPPPPPPPSRPGQAAHPKTLSSVPPPPPPPLLPSHKVGPKNAFPVAPPPPPAPAFSSKASSISSLAAPKGVPKAPALTSSNSGKGRLSRTISSKRNCKKLKPLHWMKITRATQGSLWAEAQKYGSIAPEIDMSELESLFSATLSMSAYGRKSIKRGKSEKLQLIEHRRAYNCEIMLSKVKIPLDVLMNSVLSLEDSALDVDQVENLIKFCPTHEEMELLKGYTGEKENLGKCEQFFLELMKVPRVESKLRVFSFKIQFRTQVSDLRRSLNIVNSASEEIRNSMKLKRIMQTILSLGNALNQGTSRGSAVGFKLDSLLKLIETRARNNKMTLMHYLCKVLAEKLPEVIDFSKDLSSLESAAKIQLKSLAEEMQAVSKGLEKVVQELSTADNDGPVAEDFCKILKEFLLYAEAEVRSLTSLYSSVGKNMDVLILYFGEDLSRCTFEQVVSTLLNFTRMFNKSHDENCKQLEREAKKLAETEKLKIVVSLKLSNEPLHSAV